VIALTPMREQLDDLLKLADGWLNGEGEAVSLACQTSALAVIDELLREGHEARMYPDIDGGVRFEWFVDDWPRPPSITFRAHREVWVVTVNNDGAVEHFCLRDPDTCATCEAFG
jgi:hypothetical protein